jgi:DNA repair and recombination protein RAD52
MNETPKDYFGQTPYSPVEAKETSSTLNKLLGPEYLRWLFIDISKRSGPGGSTLTYLEGWKAINLANEIFKFNGWSHQIVSQTVDFVL